MGLDLDLALDLGPDLGLDGFVYITGCRAPFNRITEQYFPMHAALWRRLPFLKMSHNA